jgi:hypothetical protein
MRAGDDQRPPVGEKEARQRLGHRQSRHAEALALRGLRVVAWHGVADDRRDRGRRRDGPGSNPTNGVMPAVGEQRRHRRIERTVAAGDAMAVAGEQRRERRRAGAADRDDVDVERRERRAQADLAATERRR